MLATVVVTVEELELHPWTVLVSVAAAIIATAISFVVGVMLQIIDCGNTIARDIKVITKYVDNLIHNAA